MCALMWKNPSAASMTTTGTAPSAVEMNMLPKGS